MKITVGDGERQLYITLFEAAEKITGCSVVDFIKSKEEVSIHGQNTLNIKLFLFFFIRK